MFNNHSKGLIVLSLISVFIVACTKEKGPIAATPSAAADTCATMSYASDIAPIIAGSCTSSGCHDSGSSWGDFTGYAGLKSDADNGKLNNRVVVAKDMPVGGAFTDAQRRKIQCWIEQGALNN